MKLCQLVRTAMFVVLTISQEQVTLGEIISFDRKVEGENGALKHLHSSKFILELDPASDQSVKQNYTPTKEVTGVPVESVDEPEAQSAFSFAFLQVAAILLVGVASYTYLGDRAEHEKKVTSASVSDSHLIGKPAILAIATANPPHRWSQEEFLNLLDWQSKNMNLDKEFVDFMRRMHTDNGVDYRYFGLPAVTGGQQPEGIAAKKSDPTVSDRHAYWSEWVPKMSVEVAKKAVSDWGGKKQDITHVVFHSCTGFKAPGVELDIVDALNLTGVKRRLGINYMGCFGGFTGMSVAKTFCEADPNARVLLVCAETCLAHYAFCNNRSMNIGNSFFADGAAAVVIGPGRPDDWVIDGEMTKTLGTDTRDLMRWAPSDHNYEMYLDKGIGKKFGTHLYRNIKSYFKELCNGSVRDVEWCVHPGGRGILDFFCSKTLGLGVDKEMLDRSYDVLRNHGNMSSGTIFFVLKNLIKDGQQRPAETKKTALCIGFGPGLTLEIATLRRIGSETG